MHMQHPSPTGDRLLPGAHIWLAVPAAIQESRLTLLAAIPCATHLPALCSGQQELQSGQAAAAPGHMKSMDRPSLSAGSPSCALSSSLALLTATLW